MSKLANALRAKKTCAQNSAPTKELLAKKALGLTDEPIDLLLKKGLISENQHQAANSLRMLFVQKFGVPHVQSSLRIREDEKPTSKISDKKRALQEEQYSQITLLLKCHGLEKIIKNLVIYSKLTDLQNAERTLSKIIEGLTILEEFFAGVRKIKKFD